LIGLDTNVIVRYLTQDDRVQAAKATYIVEHVLTEDNAGFVSVVAMVETVWVLERAYGFGGKAIASAIEALLAIDVLVIQSEQEIFAAMIALKANRGSFADALIGALGAAAGCAKTLTFDRKASRMAAFAPA